MANNTFEIKMFDDEYVCFSYKSIIVCNKNIKNAILNNQVELEAPSPYIIVTIVSAAHRFIIAFFHDFLTLAITIDKININFLSILKSLINFIYVLQIILFVKTRRNFF